MNKLDIVEAILAGVVPNPAVFDEGQILMSLSVNTFPSRMSVPLILRHQDGSDRFWGCTPFAVGTSKEEVLRRVTKAVDRLFHTLETTGWQEFVCVKCGHKFMGAADCEGNNPICHALYDRVDLNSDGSASEVRCGGFTKPSS